MEARSAPLSKSEKRRTPIGRQISEGATMRVPVVAFESHVSVHDTPLRPAPPLLTGATQATLTILSGLEAGRVVRLVKETTVIGRDADADVTIEDGSISRRHACLTRGTHGDYRIDDLGSTNGTYVCAREVESAALCPDDYIQLGPNVLLRFALCDERDEQLRRTIFESSVRDHLTGTFDRRYFAGRLSSEIAHAARSSRNLAVFLIDVDHFKVVNDAFGHLAGDSVLCAVAQHLERALRAGDVAGRYGGDEFVALARDAGPEEALRID